MGLGKTAVTITSVKQLSINTALIIVPAILKTNWQSEFLKFANKKVHIPKSNQDVDPDTINVVSYEFAMSHFKSLPKKWDLLVCDESHYLKNPKSKRTQSILGKGGIAHGSKRTWLLSGTPAPNNPAELWTTLFTFGQTNLKYNEFVRTYCDFYENAWGAVIITGLKYGADVALKKLLEPILYKKTKADVELDLPPLRHHYLDINPKRVTISQIEIDKSLRELFLTGITPTEFLEDLKRETLLLQDMLSSQNELDVINVLSSQAQSISTVRRYMGIQKVLEIMPLLREELENHAYPKIVIFAAHVRIVEYIARELQEFGARSIYGETPAKERDLAVELFQKDSEECRVLVCGISTAGVGLNLTRSSEVMMLELSYTPAYNEQAIMRCHRIGSQKAVRVRYVRLKDSLDGRIMEILTRKSDDNEKIFN